MLITSAPTYAVLSLPTRARPFSSSPRQPIEFEERTLSWSYALSYKKMLNLRTIAKRPLKIYSRISNNHMGHLSVQELHNNVKLIYINLILCLSWLLKNEKIYWYSVSYFSNNRIGGTFFVIYRKRFYPRRNILSAGFLPHTTIRRKNVPVISRALWWERCTITWALTVHCGPCIQNFSSSLPLLLLPSSFNLYPNPLISYLHIFSVVMLLWYNSRRTVNESWIGSIWWACGSLSWFAYGIFVSALGSTSELEEKCNVEKLLRSPATICLFYHGSLDTC